MNKPLWQPSKELKENSLLQDFCKSINFQSNYNFKNLWEWSIKKPEQLRYSFWTFSKSIEDNRIVIIKKENVFNKTKFFPDSKLNYTENILKKKSDEVAINFLSEKGNEEKITWNQLHEKVCRLSSYLKKLNLKKGDRVAAYVPNKIETVICLLACAKNGLVWSSCSPDFGVEGVVDRFKQIKPKILITCDYYFYNGKQLNILEKVEKILNKISSIEKTIVFHYNKKFKTDFKNFTNFDETLKSDQDQSFERFEFSHPIYILYSSGTTGKPKCITHGAGNVLIEHNKEFMLHCDIKDNEKLFYYTTTGWMMWNWLVGGMASGASIFLFDGAPVYPKIDVLLKYCQNKRINLFGVSAKYIDHLKNEKYNSKNLDLSSIKIITSTGSPLAEESFKYVYKNINIDSQTLSLYFPFMNI